jgi:polyisoprenoid-binding protein YceI
MRVLFLSVPWVLAAQQATHEIRSVPGSRFALEVFKSKMWEGRKHTFVFDRFSGVLKLDNGQPGRSTVRFAVESASARCVDDWVKPNQIKDIEKAAMQEMAAAAFPEITFHSTAIIVKSSNEYEVQGLLTIRDQTKQVALMVRRAQREGGIWVEGSGQVRLSDFGLKPPRGVPGVGLFIGTKDEMRVQFVLMASRP